MPVDSQDCKLYIVDELNGGQLLVSFGRAWMERLPVLTYETITVEEAVNEFVAWPKTLIELDTSMNKASRGPSHVPDQAAEGNKHQKKLGKKPINS
ncbi:hypothetical protein TIFTF001_021654 [Ficus carica]|uniref:Uncharacterized protein n=1 Tax=Ficus carica TaxID=3494 RepID=A0AA88AV30_FICCA|nr:hypothetical protein TIFTF001_021654 [Ficus carica]